MKVPHSNGLAAALLVLAPAAPCAARDISTFVEADDGSLLATDVYQRLRERSMAGCADSDSLRQAGPEGPVSE